MQEGHAIASKSHRLQEQVCVLGIYKKELLAVIHALDSWKHYLLGNPFIIRTDHQSIKYSMSQTKLSVRFEYEEDTRSICAKRWISSLWLKAMCHKGFES